MNHQVSLWLHQETNFKKKRCPILPLPCVIPAIPIILTNDKVASGPLLCHWKVMISVEPLRARMIAITTSKAPMEIMIFPAQWEEWKRTTEKTRKKVETLQSLRNLYIARTVASCPACKTGRPSFMPTTKHCPRPIENVFSSKPGNP